MPQPDSIQRRYHPSFTDQEGIRYEGEVDNQGRRDGRGIALYLDETLYEGYFVEGKRQGRGRSIKVDQEVYTGEFFNDCYHGFGFNEFSPDHEHGPGWTLEGYFFQNF